MSSFQGKVALVTGGSRGIGKAIALELACRGAHIAFNYFRQHEAARSAQREIEGQGVRCLSVRANLAEPEEIRELFHLVQREFQHLDILVNNAASGVARSVVDLTEKHWQWTMDVNARAAWLCAKEAIPLMQPAGSIVNVSSLGSQRVLPDYFAVGTSKAALEAVTRYLAVELASRGINVNAVSAGLVETEALRHFPQQEAMRAAARSNTPGGRPLAAQDIARVVAFLCSSDAAMVRGQVIVVDGGMSLVT